jgi:hypothetical protein
MGLSNIKFINIWVCMYVYTYVKILNSNIDLNWKWNEYKV